MKRTIKMTLVAALVMAAMSFGTLEAKPAKIKVNGKCNICKAKIEKAAKGVKGVKTAVWDKDTKVLTIDYNEKLTDVKAVEKAVATVGYDAGDEKANVEARKKLPACCTSDTHESHHKDGGCSK